MEAIIFDLALVFHAAAIGLGVGSSTLAISSFLVAIYDGTIETGERRMLGVIYWALRVAMVSILFFSVAIYLIDPGFFGAFNVYLAIMLAVLYLNAGAMTFKLISPKLGPSIQAGTWYTLGFMMSIHMFELFEPTFVHFLLLYAADIAFFLIIVNLYLIYLKRQKRS